MPEIKKPFLFYVPELPINILGKSSKDLSMEEIFDLGHSLGVDDIEEITMSVAYILASFTQIMELIRRDNRNIKFESMTQLASHAFYIKILGSSNEVMDLLSLMTLAQTLQYYKNDELVIESLSNEREALLIKSGPSSKKSNPKVNAENRRSFQRGCMLAIRGTWNSGPVYRPRSVLPNVQKATTLQPSDFEEFFNSLKQRLLESEKISKNIKDSITKVSFESITKRVQEMVIFSHPKVNGKPDPLNIVETDIILSRSLGPLEDITGIRREIVSTAAFKVPVLENEIPSVVKGLLKKQGREIKDINASSNKEK